MNHLFKSPISWFFDNGRSAESDDAAQLPANPSSGAPDHLSMLSQISAAAANTADVDRFLAQIPQILFNHLNPKFVGLFLFLEDEHVLRLHTAVSDEQRPVKTFEPVYVNGNHLLGEVARNGRPIVVGDLFTAEYQPHPYKQTGARSEIAVPMVVQGRLFGVLNIQCSTIASFDTDTVQQAIHTAAQQVCAKLRECELEDKLRSMEQIDEHINHLNSAITHQTDVNDAINLVLSEICAIFPADDISLIRLNPEGYQYRPAITDKSHEWVNIESPIDQPGSPIREVLRAGQPVIVNQIPVDTEWAQHLGQAIRHQIRSWIGLPVTNGHEMIGVLAVARANDKFNANETEIATTVIEQANSLMANVLHHGVHQSFNQQLEEEVRERTIELIEAYQQLEKLDRAKVDFIQVAAHELRTPLTVLRGYTDILSREAEIQANEYHNSILSGISSGVSRLEEIIDDMLIVSRLDNQTYVTNPEPLKPDIVIKSLVRKLKPATQKRRIQIRATSGLNDIGMMMADRDAMHKLFYHLLINAIKYTPDGGMITVDAKSVEKGSKMWVEFMVHDEGIGIDPQHQDLIFEKFYQTGKVALHSSGRTQYKGGGPGLGLAIVEGFVDAHGGKVWVESEGYNEETFPGSTFHIQMPQAPDMS